MQPTGRSRRLADDGRHLTNPAVRFAGIFVGILNAAHVVIFSVAQHPQRPSRRPAYSQNSSLGCGVASSCSAVLTADLPGSARGRVLPARHGDKHGGRVRRGEVVTGGVVERLPLVEGLFREQRRE